MALPGSGLIRLTAPTDGEPERKPDVCCQAGHQVYLRAEGLLFRAGNEACTAPA
ncbi:MAG: hypothetical protein WAK71_08665 [Streptosporangiaceae bacterium]